VAKKRKAKNSNNKSNIKKAKGDFNSGSMFINLGETIIIIIPKDIIFIIINN
jgi:hypothetical protein